MDASLSADLIVSAQIRRAAREGISITVVRRGYQSSGAIFLKINLLNGTARILSQVRYDEELVWTSVGNMDPMPEKDADLYLEKQVQFDPDCWIIEIEDKQGRHWFPGRVLR